MDISTMLEVQVSEVKEQDSKENVTPRSRVPSTTKGFSGISQEESNFYKFMFGDDIAKVRFRKLHCTACDSHIGSAPSQAYRMFEHPVLHTLLCEKCREFYGDGRFEQGDDATDMFCRWCANGGNLYCCSYCSNTFCCKCIKRNFDPLVRKKIEADEKWKCFVCDPADLYTARAVCWAALQHIQTVTRILQNDRKMSPEELEEKMNLDESQCCPRRRKRKRRRTASNSEDDDETYVPNMNGMSFLSKRRIARKITATRRAPLVNGTMNSVSTPIPIRPRTTLPLQNIVNPVGRKLLHPSEQLQIEQNLISINAETATASSVRDNTLPYKYDSTPVQVIQPSTVQATQPSTIQTVQPVQRTTVQSLYNPSIINVLPTASLLQSNSLTSTHQLVLSTSQIQYQPTYCTTTPMVTIPNQQSKMMNCTRVLLPKPSKSTKMVVTPNIIELDSDSDEPIVVESTATKPVNSESAIVDVDISEVTAVPVALVSTENSWKNEMQKTQSLRELGTTLEKQNKPFSEAVLLPQSYEVDLILKYLKVKFSKLYEDAKTENVKQNKEEDAHNKIKQFHKDIRHTIIKLADINDTAIREYNSWKRMQSIQNNINPSSTKKATSSKRNIEIPLDMTCINDSAAESDSYSDDENTISPSNLMGFMNVGEGLTCFREKVTIDCGVGNHSVLYNDKSVQVYDIVPRDLEKCIGYSLLTKADYNPVTKNSVLKPVPVPNEYFGKYEEQFIFYLQHIEDHGFVDTEESKGLPDPNETSLKDLIEANSPFISEMLENIDPSITSNNSYRSEQNNEENNVTHTDELMETESLSSISEMMTTASSKAVDELERIVTKLSDDLDIQKKEGLNNQSHENAVEKAETCEKETSAAEKTNMDEMLVENQKDCQQLMN